MVRRSDAAVVCPLYADWFTIKWHHLWIRGYIPSPFYKPTSILLYVFLLYICSAFSYSWFNNPLIAIIFCHFFFTKCIWLHFLCEYFCIPLFFLLSSIYSFYLLPCVSSENNPYQIEKDNPSKYSSYSGIQISFHIMILKHIHQFLKSFSSYKTYCQ